MVAVAENAGSSKQAEVEVYGKDGSSAEGEGAVNGCRSRRG